MNSHTVSVDHGIANNATAAAERRKRRPVLTLRVVMSLLTAVIVLAVAAITFSITYTQGFDSSDRTGKKYTNALVTAARIQLEGMFTETVRFQQTFMRQTQSVVGLRLPAEDAADSTTDTFRSLDAVARNIVSAPFTIPSKVANAGTVFDDGSIAGAQIGRHASNGSFYVDVFVGNAESLNATSSCCLTWKQTTFELPGMASYPSPRPPFLPLTDSRFVGYGSIRNLLSGVTFGLWIDPIYSEAVSPPAHALPAFVPLRNQTHFLGLNFLGISMSSIEAFLGELPGTKGTTFFALTRGSIVATTHPVSTTTLSYTTSATVADSSPPNCASSTLGAPAGTTNFTIACRTMLVDAAFPAAREAANVRTLISPPAGGRVVLETITADGKKYYAAAASIPNDFRSFPLTMLVLVPRDDVLGDIVRSGRMTAGITAAVFVLASVLAFLVVNAVLRPLTDVSVNMARTARLQDTAADQPMSALREVHDLQVAFSGMNAAIKSFTRYVPRDVVKDLLASGQLCEIRMIPTWCTMLFVDISGFTSMCERVPPDELSMLVGEYFQRMSVIVMDHGGVIDKYIGDCIMAIWGAPARIGNQESRGTLCAMQLDRETRVEPLQGLFDSAGERLSVRVGVASGTVLAGNMGSEERMSYTVIGDDCNLAARCEALNKQFGTRVIVAEATANRLPPGLFSLRLLHRIQVVGKHEPVALYEVLGLDLSDPDAKTAGVSPSRSRRVVLPGLQQTLAEDERVPGAGAGSESDRHSKSVLSASGSVYSTMSDGTGYTKMAAKTCAKLVEQAAALTDGALFPTPEVLAFADVHTRAVRAYCDMRFGECVALIEGAGSGLLAGVAERDPASQRLLEQAREAVARPPDRGTFVAAWRATEK